jgi:hypothetical protein
MDSGIAQSLKLVVIDFPEMFIIIIHEYKLKFYAHYALYSNINILYLYNETNNNTNYNICDNTYVYAYQNLIKL